VLAATGAGHLGGEAQRLPGEFQGLVGIADVGVRVSSESGQEQAGRQVAVVTHKSQGPCLGRQAGLRVVENRGAEDDIGPRPPTLRGTGHDGQQDLGGQRVLRAA
jgi:hypothetical protein